MKVISIVGYHNTGKTTLIEELVKKLIEGGYRVGYIKHDPKGHGITDKEGSDTERIFRVAERVVLASPGKLTLWTRFEDDPLKIADEFFKGFDIVILEGYKSLKGIPKVALGNVEAEDVILRIEEGHGVEDIIELLERMEENL